MKNREKERTIKGIQVEANQPIETLSQSKKTIMRVPKNKILHKVRRNMRKILPKMSQIRAERIKEKYESYRKRKQSEKRRMGGKRRTEAVNFNVELDMYET